MSILNIVVAAWLLTVVIVTSDGGLSVPEVLGTVNGGGALVVTWLVVIAVKKLKKHPFQLRAALVAPVLFGVGAVLLYSDLGILLRFYPSRPALIEYAAQIREHPEQPYPARRVGLFVARETELLPGGVVRIITAEEMFDHSGVVFSPSGTPPVVGEDYYKPMGGGWWRWRRSW